MTYVFRTFRILITTAALLLFSSGITLAHNASVQIIGDTRSSANEWNDFFHSGPGTFQPHTGYRISFNYKVLTRNPDANFYLVVNDLTQTGKTFGFSQWSGASGSAGKFQTIFIDWDTDHYSLVIGIQNRAEIAIDNLQIVRDPLLKPLPVSLPRPTRSWTAKIGQSYYVDSLTGSDSAPGTSVATPWRTLTRVNAGKFTPGDHIYLRSGSVWTGFLAPGGSGAPEKPITVDAYGAGPKPRINTGGKWLAVLSITNSSYITVRNLELTNRGRIPQPNLTGVEVEARNCGEADGITLDGLYVHDVTGSELKSEGGGAGIDCSCFYDKIPTRFNGLTIENCHLKHTDRNGITVNGPWTRDPWNPCENVIIQHNFLEDIGGDGIVPVGCEGALVAYNILRGGRTRTPDYAAGIWPWSCDNTVIEHNEVSGMKGINDAEGFDSDWNCKHSVFQYNYSHNNEGGFILICDDGSKYPPYNIGNSGTVIRYNVSVNDGRYSFNICGPAFDAQIYNNTIYVGKGSASELVDGGYWGGWPVGMHFSNNMFYAAKTLGFDFGQMTNATFRNNAFWGPFTGRPNDPKAVLVNPRLIGPGSASAALYRPRKDSPLFNRGDVIPANGGHDFLGSPVPASVQPTIGGFQR